MLLLGLLLMAGAGAFTGLLIADNLAGGPHYTVSVLGHDIATMNTLGAFLTGVALTLLFGLGLLLLLSAAHAGAGGLPQWTTPGSSAPLPSRQPIRWPPKQNQPPVTGGTCRPGTG